MSGTIFLSSSEISVGEKDGTVLVTIIRQGDLSSSVEITYEITPASTNPATAGLDYRADPMLGTVTIPAGGDRISIPITIINDTLSEPTESFVVSLVAVSSGELLAPRTARIDILDDENPVLDQPEPPLQSDYNVSQEAVISGLNQPIDFDFSPIDSSLLYIAEKGGRIKVYDLETRSYISTFVDLSTEVNDIQDRGLLDVAIHPDFANNPYVYVFYVVDPPETATRTGNAGPDGAGNRFAYLVRLEADPDTNFTTIKPGPDAKVILLGGAGQSLSDISGGGAVDSTLPSTVTTTPASDIDPKTGDYIQDYIKVDSRSHAGGALAFGPDGNLYVSIGDGTSFNFADPRTFSVQDLDSLAGKILRIDPLTGEGLPDNPFVESGMNLDSNMAKVYQLGLRNPFSMGFDNDGRLFITETGWNSFEEINTGGPGANFGWPFYEGGDLGKLNTNNYKSFPEAQAFFDAVASGAIQITAPFRAFSHATSDPGYQVQAITGGGVVYDGSRYPIGFQNDYFFTDFSQGEVFSIDVNDRREVTFLYKTATGYGPTHFLQGPDGYIYTADLITGTIRRLDINYKAPIVANADTIGTQEGTSVALDVLANDRHPTGELLAIASVSGPVHGTARVEDNGTPLDPTDDFIRYTPDQGFSGIDTFTYVASDGRDSSTGQVSVLVGTMVSDETFETAPQGWSSGTRASVRDANGQSTLALGQFSGGAPAQKSFVIPAGVGTVIVSFDLYELDSWDGDKGDAFYVTVNGRQVLLEEFYHQGRAGTDGDDPARSGVTGNVAWSITPLTDNSANLGGANSQPWHTDQIHRVTLTITDPGQMLSLGLGSTLNQGVADESFAIDNVRVIAGGEPTPPPPPPPDLDIPAEETETFEATPYGWSSISTATLLTAEGEQTSALGRFGRGEVIQKTFANPFDLEEVSVSFDFYELDSWDGDKGDALFVTINGQTVLLEEFYHQGRAGTDGNDAARSGVSGNVTWSITPLTDNSANLGGANSQPWHADQIHRVTLTITDPGQMLSLGLGSTLDQGVVDESFAIDNLKVAAGGGNTDPIPPVITMATETFDAGTQGWSSGGTVNLLTADGQPTRGLGPFSTNDTVQKSFLIPDGASQIALEFDFYELDSWDGDRGDAFFVTVNGREILLEEFYHQGRAGTDGNDPARSGVSGNVTWSIAPLTDNSNNLGGANSQPWHTDQIHRVTLNITDPGETLTVGLGSTLNQGVADESFAIDNYALTVFSGDLYFI